MEIAPPSGFSWVVPGILAAMAYPRDLRRDLEFLKEARIGVIVSLTETPLQEVLIAEFGFEYHHMPIPDFTAPSYDQLGAFVRIVRRAKAAGKATAIHCLAGRGRTGTLAAAYLVSEGRGSADALAEIRRLRPGSVETPEQEEAVHAFAFRWRNCRG
jgi:atypical dual specificity phosphatase